MNYSLKSWTKPGTDEVRIYVRGYPLESEDKLYIFAKADGSWDARLYCPYGPNHIFFSSISGLGDLYHAALTIAERALAERQLDRATFASIVAVLAGTGEAVAFDPISVDHARRAAEAATLAASRATSRLAVEARGSYEDSVRRLRQARRIIKADQTYLDRLMNLKLTGAKKLGTKGHERDTELCDLFGASIGVPGLTPEDVKQLKVELG